MADIEKSIAECCKQLKLSTNCKLSPETASCAMFGGHALP